MVVRVCTLFILGLILVACNSGGSIPATKKPLNKVASSTSAQSNLIDAYGGESDFSAYVGLAGVQPYQLVGTYADVLPDCVIAVSSEFSCTLATLPFLAHETKELSVDSIMSRVVVSHQWMGERFNQALLALPVGMLPLFKSVTAVVIADDIRPSYFSNLTGAIYLDSQLLWQTLNEKTIFQLFADTGLQVGAGQSLQSLKFRSWSRYVKEGALAFTSYSAFDDSVRTIDDTLLPIAALLFHELAHANDFFPPQRIVQAAPTLTAYDLAGLQKGYRPSDLLQDFSPLHSESLFHFAQVMYLQLGVFSVDELAATAESIALDFDSHAANDDYAFVHQFEDAAMLFEEAMMRYYFQVDRDVAYLNAPARSNAECDDYSVAWGMRNRGSREEIKLRAQLVVEAIAPGLHWPAYFASLNAPQYLQVGSGWCESISIDANSVTEPAQSSSFLFQPLEPLTF